MHEAEAGWSICWARSPVGLTVPVSEQSKAPDKSFEPIDGFTIKVHYSLQIEVLRGAYALIIGLEWEVEEDSILLWRDQGGWRWSWMR